MNEIQQISLKLRLGIDPDEVIEPKELLRQWGDRCRVDLERRIQKHKHMHHAIGRRVGDVALVE